MSEFIAELENIGIRRHFKKGNIVFYEGERARSFFLLLRGRVRVYKSPSQSKEITLHYFMPTSFIAEMPAFREALYPASAVCEEDCEVIELEFTRFKKLCEKDVNFALMMMSSLFEKIKILEREIFQHSITLKERVVHYLLENEAILPRISQREIATTLNIRAESLSRTIKELKNAEFIDTCKGKIVILDRERLNEML